jgi:tRNA threonylcarbamoyl adenosine modification protein YeaZ
VLLLAFDTATPAVTVALHDGARVISASSAVAGHQHGELLGAAIGAVLADAGASAADLTAVAVGTGPGPYTGLRAGLITAKVLASALGIRLDGLCSLDVIAADAAAHAGGREFLVATDARRKEVYWARYSAAGRRLSGPGVARPAALPAGYPVAGAGAELYPELAAGRIRPCYPDAGRLADMAVQRVAARTPPAPAEPLYLRRPDVAQPHKPKAVTR